MRNLILFLAAIVTTLTSAFAQTQSIIYDATAIMNAKHGVNALLIPNDNGFDAYDSRSGDKIELEDIINAVTGFKDGVKLPASFIVSANSNDVILEILRRNAGLPVGASPDEIKTAYANNPFLKDILDVGATGFNTNDISSVGKTVSSSLVGAIGANILGNLVNGTADFLIKRAKEEISVSVIDQLKKFLDKHPEFDVLFSNTCTLIRKFESFDYNKALSAFKAAIKEDLSVLVSRIALLYDLPKYQLLNKKVPALTLVFAASTALSEIEGDGGFANGLWVLSQQSYLAEENNYASVMKLVGICSNSLLDKKLSDPEDGAVKYVNKDYIKLVTHQNIELKVMLSRIYLGLLWQRTSAIKFTTGNVQHTVGSFLNRWAADAHIEKALETVDQSFALYSKLNDEFKQLKEQEQQAAVYAGNNSTNYKRLVFYSKVISGGLSLCKIFIDPAKNDVNRRIQAIQDYLPQFSEKLADMLIEFQNEDYNLGISRFEELLTVVSEYLKTTEEDKTAKDNLTKEFLQALKNKKDSLNKSWRYVDSVRQKLPSVASAHDNIERADLIAWHKEYEQQLNEIAKEIKHIESQEKNKNDVLFYLARVIRYVNLLAAISKAENSKAVENLLETYALPAGSSRVKKVSPWNIALNAYVGAFGFRSDDMGKGFTNKYGFTAPIGFSISKGFDKVGSVSLFLHPFDIGGTIKYKQENPDEYQQDISLGGIISPGIHVVYGFPCYLPFAIGLGYQWISPATTTSNDIKLTGTFNAFIAVDIPLFNLAPRKPLFKSSK